MTTIKSYTDISQSKKLTEILPIDSADMQWFLEEDYGIVQIKEGLQDWGGDCTIPCWSLAALLGVIKNYKLSSEHNYQTCTAETSFGKETVGWFDNPVDACVAMIEKLNELNLL